MKEGTPPEGIDLPEIENDPSFGVPEERITTRVDVGEYIDRKREAMRAHASQIAETSFFLQMPPEVFARVFGQEWFIRPGHQRQGDDDWETQIL
jgi:LmbE family N-acetylglucosaminyl deacetylase